MSVLFAFGTVPKDGGTFTFYQNIRPVLERFDIRMRAVSVGKGEAGLWDRNFADDGCVLLAPGTYNVKRQAMSFAGWCERERADIVMGVNSLAILSALPHLPERIRALSRCANAFDHGYRITMSGAGRLARIVALSPRLKQDLIAGYGADPDRVDLIPNGIDPRPFDAAAHTTRGRQAELQLGFLGRLEHNQKGVFHLPEIVRALDRSGIAFRLRIAGQGKHRKTLVRALAPELSTGRVELVGPLTRQEVPQFLAGTDVFVFTSHFEGFPNALLEAMMAGCVPISWRIAGITDFMFEHAVGGFQCETGAYDDFARCAGILFRDREKLRRMSRTVAALARSRFDHVQAGEAYADLVHRVMAADPPPWRPVPWDAFRPDANFDTSWKRMLSSLPGFRQLAEVYRNRARNLDAR